MRWGLTLRAWHLPTAPRTLPHCIFTDLQGAILPSPFYPGEPEGRGWGHLALRAKQGLKPADVDPAAPSPFSLWRDETALGRGWEGQRGPHTHTEGRQRAGWVTAG